MNDKKVANCDVCDTRLGTHTVIAYGVETWVCDRCPVEHESKNVENMARVMDHFLEKLK